MVLTDSNGNTLTFSSGILMQDVNGNILDLSAYNLSIADFSGNNINLTPEGITVTDDNGNTVVLNGAGVSVTDLNGNSIVMEGGQASIIFTGSNGNQFALTPYGLGVPTPLFASFDGPGALIKGNSQSPRSATTAGSKGQIEWDAENIYICATGGEAGHATWKAAALTTI
jgi:hypothetical protein